jgi:hypothetical protein
VRGVIIGILGPVSVLMSKDWRGAWQDGFWAKKTDEERRIIDHVTGHVGIGEMMALVRENRMMACLCK